HVLALAVEEIDQQAAARQRTRHVLEHEAWRVVGMRRELRHHADVALPGEPLEGLHLAELLRLIEPLAQVVIGKMRRRVGAKASGGTIGCPTTAERRRHAVGLRVLFGHTFNPEAFCNVSYYRPTLHRGHLRTSKSSAHFRAKLQCRCLARPALVQRPKYLYC